MDRVYVANLPPDIRIKDIDDFFRPFGKLVYIDVNNRSNPVYAYVQFDNARNAFNAVKSRHGYDYEGYTLQLRLVGNEVRNRDATPPPPPPPMFNSFEQQSSGGGFNNRMGGNMTNMTSFQTNTNSQWSNINRSSMPQQTQQQNMIQYPTINRGNMVQRNMDYSSNNRQQNMMQSASGTLAMPQQYSNTSRTDMLQQYSSSNRSNVQQQYTNSTHSNMSQQNVNYQNRSDMSEPNIYSSNSRTNMQDQYANPNRSNISQQQHQMNMMDVSKNTSWNNGNNSSWNAGSNSSWNNNNNSWNSGNNNSWNSGNNNSWDSGNNSSWNSGTNNMNRNSGNRGADRNNARPKTVYNASTDPYANDRYQDNYTKGLSGSGRKWFNRFIRQGLSPEIARAKALEHRTLPYLRDDPKNKKLAGDPTNAALENIGNTIINFLATKPSGNMQQGFVNGGDGINNNNAVQSSSQTLYKSKSEGKNLKPLEITKTLKANAQHTATDIISSNAHEMIIKHKKQPKNTRIKPVVTLAKVRNDQSNKSTLTVAELSEMLRKKKDKLLIESTIMGGGKKKRHVGAAFRKRLKLLMNEGGLSEFESRILALHNHAKLSILISLKNQIDMATRKNLMQAGKSQTVEAYLNDVKYLGVYQNTRITKLNKNIIASVAECVNRIHKYEKEHKLPRTYNKFIKLLDKLVNNQNLNKTTNSDKMQVDEEKKVEVNVVKHTNGNLTGDNDFTQMSSSTSCNIAKDTQINLTSSEVQLCDKFRNKKDELLLEATRIIQESSRKPGGKAYKNRIKLLMNHSCASKLEANSLAVLHIDKIKDLISLKMECDMVNNKAYILVDKQNLTETEKYHNNIKFLGIYEKEKKSELNQSLKNTLWECITKIHKYEMENRLPLTKSKFITLIPIYKNENEMVVNNTTTISQKEVEEKHKENPKDLQEKSENNENITIEELADDSNVECENAQSIIERSSELSLVEQIKKTKDRLLKQVRSMDKSKKIYKSYKRRLAAVIGVPGIAEHEAKSLALLHFSKLKRLVSLLSKCNENNFRSSNISNNETITENNIKSEEDKNEEQDDGETKENVQEHTEMLRDD